MHYMNQAYKPLLEDVTLYPEAISIYDSILKSFQDYNRAITLCNELMSKTTSFFEKLFPTNKVLLDDTFNFVPMEMSWLPDNTEYGMVGNEYVPFIVPNYRADGFASISIQKANPNHNPNVINMTKSKNWSKNSNNVEVVGINFNPVRIVVNFTEPESMDMYLKIVHSEHFQTFILKLLQDFDNINATINEIRTEVNIKLTELEFSLASQFGRYVKMVVEDKGTIPYVKNTLYKDIEPYDDFSCKYTRTKGTSSLMAYPKILIDSSEHLVKFIHREAKMLIFKENVRTENA